MADHSKIEWTDSTWNPIRGCSRVSEGCKHCYAERIAARFSGPGMPYEGLIHRSTGSWNGQVRFIEGSLFQPIHWRKNRRVFVNSMSDLFHESVPDETIDKIFAVMLACNILTNVGKHQFQILTKRPQRMVLYLTQSSPAEMLQRWSKSVDYSLHIDDGNTYFSEYVYSQVCRDWDENGNNPSLSEHKPWGYAHRLFPLPNVWLGVSVEDQKTADERIPVLLQCPAAVRWLSCEPLLGPIDLERPRPGPNLAQGSGTAICQPWLIQSGIDWVVAGGESGAGARPMHPDWARSLRNQCASAGVPFFFKQHGEYVEATVRNIDHARESRFVERSGEDSTGWTIDRHTRGTAHMVRLGKSATGRLLDGVEHNAFPEAAIDA